MKPTKMFSIKEAMANLIVSQDSSPSVSRRWQIKDTLSIYRSPRSVIRLLPRMTALVATLVLVFLIPATLQLQDSTFGVSDHPTTLEERDAIITRLARHAGEIYTQHDVAVVLHEREPNDFHHISKRDLGSVTNEDEDGMIRNIRLELASGSEMNLQLKKRSLFDPNTQFIDSVGYGRVKRAMRPLDCYAAGDVVKNGKSQGSVSVATCSGLHGKAFSNGMEYYIHPVDHVDGEQHHVHLFSRSAPENKINPGLVDVDDSIPVLEDFHVIKHRRSIGEKLNGNKRTVTRFVFEMAVVVDSRFWSEIHKLHPNREDESILLVMAGVSALFGDLEDLGYDPRIKIKMYEVWIVDPEDYNYQHDDVLENVYSFCHHTKKNYNYDLHYLFTGSPTGGTGWNVGKVCNSQLGCSGAASSDTVLTAHEIGHSVGLTHDEYADCPDEDKRSNFMNGKYRKTPCIKWELDTFFDKGEGKCLFEETKETKTSEKFTNLPPVITGQYFNPDTYCKYKFGDDYELFRPYDFRGDDECYSLMCINRNKDSQGYLRIDRLSEVPFGYTCGDDMFCDGRKCNSWDSPDPPIIKHRLDEIKRKNQWSDWSRGWTPCSHTCGTGVQLKRRRCLFSEGPFLSPYCTGSPIQFRPCNEEPCSEEPVSIDKKREAIGNEICERFHKNNVSLTGSDSFLPRSADIKHTSKRFPNKSCFFTCVRNPSPKNIIDSIYPDGTPCKGSSKREKLGIKFRCVEGACSEFSGCPGNERKDGCGLCGENPDRCVDRKFNESDDPGVSVLKTLAVLPVGTKNIDINMLWHKNPGVYLYVYDSNDNKMFGSKDGQIIRKDRFSNEKFANATWQYSYRDIVKADGPIDQELKVKVIRIEELNPIREIFATYILPSSSPSLVKMFDAK